MFSAEMSRVGAVEEERSVPGEVGESTAAYRPVPTRSVVSTQFWMGGFEEDGVRGRGGR